MSMSDPSLAKRLKITFIEQLILKHMATEFLDLDYMGSWSHPPGYAGQTRVKPPVEEVPGPQA